MQHERKIIEDLKEILSHHHEPYEEGSWEVFRERYKSVKTIQAQKQRFLALNIWKPTAVAAAIVLIAILFSKNIEQPDSSNSSKYIAENVTNNQSEKQNKTFKNKKKSTHPHYTGKSQPSMATDLNKESKEKKTGFPKTTKMSNRIDLFKTMAKSRLEKSALNTYVFTNTQPVVFTKQQTDSHSGSRWKFGLELISSVVSEKIHFGAGVLTEFNISDKLILATGFSYTQLDGLNRTEPIFLSPSLRQTGSKTAIQAIDIPLSLKYQTNSGVYASIGISSFNILNENKVYKYEMDILSETVNINPDTGAESIEYITITKEYSEHTDDKDFKSINSLNYLNFSIGKKLNVLEGRQVLVEPFVKVPLGSFSNKKPDLMNTGIKLKLLF